MANKRYKTPDQGVTDWHTPLNENFDNLNTDVEFRGLDSELEAYEPVAGAKFLATDTGTVYIGEGSHWKQLGSLGRATSTSEAPHIVFDPSTDNIQTVINDAPPYSTIVQSTGEQATVNGILIEKPLTLWGLNVKLSSNPASRVVDDWGDAGVILIDSTTAVRIINCRLDANKSGNSESQVHGINGSSGRCSNVVIRNNHITDFSYYGIDINSWDEVVVESNLIENGDNRHIRGHSTTGGYIANNICRPDTRNWEGAGVISNDGRRTAVVGNDIIVPTGSNGIIFTNLGSFNQVANIVAHNTITGQERNTVSSGRAIRTASDATVQMNLTGNYIKDLNMGVRLANGWGLIANNVFDNCETGVRVFHGTGDNGVTIASNQFRGPGDSGRAVRISDSENVLVTSNRISDFYRGVREDDGETDYNYVHGNFLQNISRSILRQVGSNTEQSSNFTR